MNLLEIKAMFRVGSRWSVMNTFRPSANGSRRVAKCTIHQIKWEHAGGPTWSRFPKAQQIIDARDGYLHYQMFTAEEVAKDALKRIDHTLTFTRLA